MKPAITTLFLLCFAFKGYSQNNSDSLKLLFKELRTLQVENENLKDIVNNQKTLLSTLDQNQKFTDLTRWSKIQTNIKYGISGYSHLGRKIMYLKSQLLNENYQNFIKKLGSVKESPLGFSFDKVILEAASKNKLFNKTNYLEKFEKVVNAIAASPITSLIPYASEAVGISNSVINIVRASGFDGNKVDEKKVELFEKELGRYISYYAALDNANILNNSLNYQTIAFLENVQIDLMDEVSKIAKLIDLPLRERKTDESIDEYSNYVFSELTISYADQYFQKLESKHAKDFTKLLNTESNVKYVNNRMDYLIELTNTFKSSYEQYFTMGDEYNNKLKKALEIANDNGIIKEVDGKAAATVYKELLNELTRKKNESHAALKASVNLQELADNNSKLDLVTF